MSGSARIAQAVCIIIAIYCGTDHDRLGVDVFGAASLIIMGCAPRKPTPSTEGQGE